MPERGLKLLSARCDFLLAEDCRCPFVATAGRIFRRALVLTLKAGEKFRIIYRDLERAVPGILRSKK